MPYSLVLLGVFERVKDGLFEAIFQFGHPADVLEGPVRVGVDEGTGLQVDAVGWTTPSSATAAGSTHSAMLVSASSAPERGGRCRWARPRGRAWRAASLASSSRSLAAKPAVSSTAGSRSRSRRSVARRGVS